MNENARKGTRGPAGLILAWILFVAAIVMLPFAGNSVMQDIAVRNLNNSGFYNSPQFEEVVAYYMSTLQDALNGSRLDEVQEKLDEAVEGDGIVWELYLYGINRDGKTLDHSEDKIQSANYRYKDPRTTYVEREFDWVCELKTNDNRRGDASGYMKLYLPLDDKNYLVADARANYTEDLVLMQAHRNQRFAADIVWLSAAVIGTLASALYLLKRAARAGRDSLIASATAQTKPAQADVLWEEETASDAIKKALRIPADLFLLLLLLMLPFAEEFGRDIGYRFNSDIGWGLSWSCIWILLFAGLLFVVYRIFERTLTKKLLSVRCAKACLGYLRRAGGWIADGIRAMKTEARTVLAAFLIFLPIFLCSAFIGALSDYNGAFALLLAVVLLAVVLLAAAKVGSYLRAIRDGARSIAEGDYSAEIPTTRLLPSVIGEHASDLNRIRDGLTEAVSEQLKSERMKTELITNVSHDIKTPLTSIVNYVDLLQKDHTPEEEKEYLEILAKQAARLKRLTENLVEASKAASGAIDIYLQPMAVSEVLSQAIGEYEEKLSVKGLKTVLHMPEKPVTVLADGRQFWRVIDNLLGNICKYSLDNTRVYIDCEEKGEEVELTFKNISAYELGISAEELTERFVRGDKSRSTEGSGLGLNIASSLMGLMKGRLELAIDGDLFKAKVVLAKAQEE